MAGSIGKDTYVTSFSSLSFHRKVTLRIHVDLSVSILVIGVSTVLQLFLMSVIKLFQILLYRKMSILRKISKKRRTFRVPSYNRVDRPSHT